MRSASAVLGLSAMSMKATLAPCRAKPSVSAAPMPDPPPVISTEAPLRSGKTADGIISCCSCSDGAHRIGEREWQDKPTAVALNRLWCGNYGARRFASRVDGKGAGAFAFIDTQWARNYLAVLPCIEAQAVQLEHMMMRATTSLLTLAAMLLSGSAFAGSSESSEDIVKFFAGAAQLGASRGICVGTEDECKSKAAGGAGADRP